MEHVKYLDVRILAKLEKVINHYDINDIYIALSDYYGSSWKLSKENLSDRIKIRRDKNGNITNKRLTSNVGLLFAISYCFNISLDGILFKVKREESRKTIKKDMSHNKVYSTTKTKERLPKIPRDLKLFKPHTNKIAILLLSLRLYKIGVINFSGYDQLLNHLVMNLLLTPTQLNLTRKGFIRDTAFYEAKKVKDCLMLIVLLSTSNVKCLTYKTHNSNEVHINFRNKIGEYSSFKEEIINPFVEEGCLLYKVYEPDQFRENKSYFTDGSLTENKIVTDIEPVRLLLKFLSSSNYSLHFNENYQQNIEKNITNKDPLKTYGFYLLGAILFYRSILKIYTNKYMNTENQILKKLYIDMNDSLRNLQKRFLTYSNKDLEIDTVFVNDKIDEIKDCIIDSFEYFIRNKDLKATTKQEFMSNLCHRDVKSFLENYIQKIKAIRFK